MQAPTANHETKIPLSLLSLFTLSAHCSVEMQYHSSTMHAVAMETAEGSLLQPDRTSCTAEYLAQQEQSFPHCTQSLEGKFCAAQ